MYLSFHFIGGPFILCLEIRELCLRPHHTKVVKNGTSKLACLALGNEGTGLVSSLSPQGDRFNQERGVKRDQYNVYKTLFHNRP